MKTHSVASWLLLTASLVSTSLTPLKTFATTDATAADSATANEETSLQPIVVNSELERSGLPLGFKPGSFVQKSKDSVESQISRSLRDVISDVPGVAFLGGPRTRAQLPQIRGLGSDRVLILEDGARQNFQSGHSGRVFSDLGGFQEVEIVKGPFSSMFGSGALGGVINMRRPTARDLMNRHGRNLGGEISLDHSSADSGFGQRYTVFGVLDRDPKSFSLDPILSYSESKAIDLKLGNGKRLPHSAHTTKEFYGGLGIQTSAFGSGTTKANLKFTSYDDSGNAPLNPAEEEIPGRNPVADTKNLKTDVVLSLRHEWKHAAFELKPFMRQTKVERVRLSDSRRDLLSIDSRGLDSFAEFETPLATRGRSVLGFEGFIDENKGERAGAVYGLFPNGETTQYGIYAQQPVDLGESFSLLAGLRADFYESKPSNTALATNEGSALSPKLYLTWETLKTETSEQSVFAGWGRGFNAPRIQDLYVSGLHFPGQPPMVPNNFFQANPNLKPEVADTFELGLRGRAQADSNPWSYSLVAFLTEANDFIVRDVNMTAGTTRLSNIDRATLYGAELHLHKTLARWSFEVSASTIRGLNRRADEPIADTPADRTAFLVGYAITDSLVLGADTEIVLDQERVPNGTLATGGYTLFNSSLNWKPSNDLTLNAKVTNLSNRAYRRHGSQIDDAGQDIRVAVTARF